MRRKLTFFLGSILLIAAAMPTFAQSKGMVVDVPFDFAVGQKTYIAGKYAVATSSPSISSMIYRLSTLDGKTSIMVAASGVESQTRTHPASLLFANLEGGHALIQIWTGGQWGAQLSTSGFKDQMIAADQKVQVVAQR
jgi:hypothetical protein